MQHLSLHLNAPYKCNECSYPITDTKTFFKHKQFYKHDEKTCIMVDNDINLPASATTGTPPSTATTTTRRKTLIGTRLRQLIQQQQQQNQQLVKQEPQDIPSSASSLSATASNEIQFTNDRDTFKCSICYPDTEPAPSTSVSTLNKLPTQSSAGASNFSLDKEQVLKHVLIVHLSFLAYKCDACAQFYAFDEPQTKQHAALVHQCGDATAAACHFKLIKTEEEINLAINRAQQYITKIAATAPAASATTPTSTAKTTKPATTTVAPATTNSNQPIDALPKYKCCKCNGGNANDSTPNLDDPNWVINPNFIL